MNVLPMVNKGLALFQWKQDVEAAEKCCQEALEIDPECEAAVATLAQLSLQQGKIDVAMRMFDKQVQLARSEPELVGALNYQYVRSPVLPYPDSLADDTSHPTLRLPKRRCSSCIHIPTWPRNLARWPVCFEGCSGAGTSVFGVGLVATVLSSACYVTCLSIFYANPALKYILARSLPCEFVCFVDVPAQSLPETPYGLMALRSALAQM